MALELVTGYQGKDHVTAEQWADFNRGIFGDAAILPVGNRMETAIQTANQISVKDGIAVFDGREVYIGYGESENIAITSGTQGMLRRDIVVVEYTREEETGIESVQFKVINGTPAASNAQDPSIQDMDIRTGVFKSQKPFCRIRLNGTAIEGVDSLVSVKEFKDHVFSEPVNNLTGTNPSLPLAAPQGKALKQLIDKINSSLNNKIVIGSNKDTVLVVTDQTINFSNGQGTINAASIASAYGKTVKNAIVQIKNAGSAVITSATISGNTITVRCSNLSGTAFTGEIVTTVLLFMC